MRIGSISGSHGLFGLNTARIGPLIGSAPSSGPIRCISRPDKGAIEGDRDSSPGHEISPPIRVHLNRHDLRGGGGSRLLRRSQAKPDSCAGLILCPTGF